MSIQEDIRAKMIEAMKAKEPVSLETYRGLITMFTNESVAKGRTPKDPLPDEEALSVIKRAVKQRKESIEQFKNGGRPELAEAEEKELAILTPLLPETMSIEEIKKIAERKKEELSVRDESEMGILMGAVIKEAKGKADGGDVKKVVEELLG